MSYNHGVSIVENPNSIEPPVLSLSGVQVAFGTAPVNLSTNLEAVVNEPVLIRTFDEAKSLLGYSDDWENYTLCQVMDASFKQLKVTPIVFVNVLDPAVHKTSIEDETVQLSNQEGKVERQGILLDSLVVKSADAQTNYEMDKDYISAFDDKGNVNISVLNGDIPADVSSLLVSYESIDPTAVTTADIIGGYDASNNKYKGIECIQVIHPKHGIIPNILLAPGFSHEAEVGAVLAAKSSKINGNFNATNVLDVAGKTKEEALVQKEENLYEDKTSVICWPKAKIRGKTYWYSAIVAATISRTDAENDSVPYKSPSNKRVPISSMVNSEDKEVFLDQVQANVLNANGIVTAINMNGWRVWGNNTAAFNHNEPNLMEPKDRFIAVRRMLDWWGNTFILNYFDKVDDPINFRLIESVVDSENIRANGFKAREQIAGGFIEFRREDNPVEQILNGKIKFIQKVAFFTPAEEIINVLEFDPTILTDYFGGE